MVQITSSRLANRGHYCPVSARDGDGMPRFNPEFFDQIFYLYPSVEAAQRGEAAGGTGVFVSVPVPNQSDRFVVYACSNKHVVGASGCSVLRVNRIDGTSDVADGDPSMWAYDAHNDLAVTLVGVNVSVHRIKCLSLDAFVTRDEARDPSGPVGVGQNVFMIGRFINHDGKLINIPSVRFGHISMMPMSIRHPSGYDQESFAVEMLSRPGFSGSPVWAYQSPFDVYIGGELNANHQAHSNAMRFIGLNWGFVTDPAEVKEEIVAAQHTAG